MIELSITDEMLIDAKNKSVEMGRLKNSITNGTGNIVGFLGELIAHKILGGTINNTYDYDLILNDKTKVDVKTKQTGYVPLSSYDCSIAALNIKQNCDYYCFVRVKNDFSIGWYLGVYPKQNYINDAVFMKKGDVDPLNGYIVKSDCYNIKISQLKEKP